MCRLNKLTTEGPEERPAIQQNLRGRPCDLCRIVLGRSAHALYRRRVLEVLSSSDRPVNSYAIFNIPDIVNRDGTLNNDLVERMLDPLAKLNDLCQKRRQCNDCSCYGYRFHRGWVE
jgi:hypothetical protein